MKSILAGWPAILFLVAASLPLPARAAVPDELFRTLKGSVGLSGDITMALKTQDSLAALGRQNPEVVVSAILQELKGLDLRDRKADDYRMALLTVIEGIGPAAEAAVPFLESIVQGEDISEWAIFKAQSALLAINSPGAREIGRAGEDRTVDRWLQQATPGEVAAAVVQHAYLIRRELRRTEPGLLDRALSGLLPES